MVQTPALTNIADPELKELVERLVVYYEPDCIYLFGSRARGDFTEDSDFDIAVVVPDSTSEEALRSSCKVKEGLRIISDVKVLTRTSFGRELHLKASMPSTILREGLLLYPAAGTSGASYISNQPVEHIQVCENRSPEEDSVRVGTTRGWIARSREDLINAAWLISEGNEFRFGMSLFHSQQSVEKLLKALLIWHDNPPRKHHDLKLLAEDCVEIESSLDPLLRSIGWLAIWSVAGRYYVKGYSEPTQAMAEEGLALGRHVYKEILKRVPQLVVDKLELP